MNANRLFLIAAVAGLLGAQGCTSVQKGAAAGGAIGAAAGAIVADQTQGVTMAQGLASGALGGVAVGGLAGDAYDQMTDKDTRREAANLRQQLADRDKELADLRAKGASDEELAALRDAKKALEDKLAALAAQNAANGDLKKELSDLDAKNRELSDLLKDREGKLAELQKQLAGVQDALNDRNKALSDLNQKLDTVQTSLTDKDKSLDDLKKQLAGMNVQLEETNRGLTLTIVDQLLFRSGKSDLSPEGRALIGKVSAIIHTNFPGRELLVEGHTDNAPIKHSGWKSNWELGAARALAVVHDMTEKQGFDPAKISATTYGEFRPAVTNSSNDGKSKNRRSVIVILPEKMPIKTRQMAAR